MGKRAGTPDGGRTDETERSRRRIGSSAAGKIVKAYKATMLGTTQKWIKTNAAVYAQMAKKDAEIRQILDDNTKR